MQKQKYSKKTYSVILELNITKLEFMNEYQNKLLEMLSAEPKVIAMLAPSFVIDFPHPQIVGMLKKLGFEKVTELTFGARMTNYWYAKYIEEHADQKYFIASPCPIIVSFVEKSYPELKEYLIPYASPMLAMSKIVKKNYPEYKIVFISPCQAKRVIEAVKYPELIDAVVTFKELSELLDSQGIRAEDFTEKEYPFDSFITERTKIYPISGGLAQTSHVQNFFKAQEIFIGDGLKNIQPILEDMKKGSSPYRFIDILNCPGGCVGGPDIKNRDLPLAEKDKLVIDYRNKSIKDNSDGIEGKKEYVLDIDFHSKL